METPLIKRGFVRIVRVKFAKALFSLSNTLTDVIRDRWYSFELCCSNVQIVKNLIHITKKWEESNFRISRTSFITDLIFP